jgi:hypothetical protein
MRSLQMLPCVAVAVSLAVWPITVSAQGAGLLEEEVVLLGAADGPGIIPRDPVRVIRDATGRYWVGYNAPELITVFEHDGTFAGTIGTRGEGPGEFRMAMSFTAIADSVVVFDGVLGRATVVGPDFVPVRTIPLDGQIFHSAGLEWPRVIVNDVGRAPRPAPQQPFRVLNLATGEMEGSFGSIVGLGITASLGHIAVSPSGDRFWTAGALALRLSEWEADGTFVRELVARPGWFPDVVQGSPIGAPDRAPDPLLGAISAVNEHQIMMVVRVPRRNWREAWAGRSVQRDPHGGTAGGPSRNELTVARIVVVDSRDGSVLVTEDRDWRVISLLPGGEVAVYDESNMAHPRVRIVRMTVAAKQ